jgi:hypothetical protein
MAPRTLREQHEDLKAALLDLEKQGKGIAYQLEPNRYLYREDGNHPMFASAALDTRGSKEEPVFAVQVGSFTGKMSIYHYNVETGENIYTAPAEHPYPEADAYAKEWFEGCGDPERDTAILLAFNVSHNQGSSPFMLQRAHLWLLATHLENPKERALAVDLLATGQDFEIENFTNTIHDIFGTTPTEVQVPTRARRNAENNIGLGI